MAVMVSRLCRACHPAWGLQAHRHHIGCAGWLVLRCVPWMRASF